jgi:hypothetical protein
MRRTIVLFTTMALTLLVASGVVLGAAIGSAGAQSSVVGPGESSPPALLALLASGRVPYVAGRRAARVRPHEAAGRGVHHAADQSHRLDHRRRQRHLRQPDPDSRFGPLGADQPSATRAARAVEALRQQEEGPRLLDPGPSSSRLLHPGAWKPSQNV